MTKEELKEHLSQLETRHRQDITTLYKEYELSNNVYKIGDIISDHSTTIKIEKIKVSILFGESQCVYEGTQLKKDGTPSKKQNNTTIFQSNIKS